MFRQKRENGLVVWHSAAPGGDVWSMLKAIACQLLSCGSGKKPESAHQAGAGGEMNET
jgi:hypothetical protein